MPEPTSQQIRDMLEARPFTIRLPLSVERRLVACARRIEADDARDGVSEEDRIQALRDLEHVAVAMIDRGLDESEKEAGVRPHPWTGHLRPAPPELLEAPEWVAPRERSLPVAFEPWWRDGWAIGMVLLMLLAAAVAVGLTLALVHALGGMS